MKKYIYRGPLSEKESEAALERMRIKPRSTFDYSWSEKKFKKRK